MPMLYAAVSFWLVGFSSAYALAFPLHLGAIGIWIGFSLGVTTFAALLVCRFHLLTLHNYLPAAPHSDATPV
jgi:MATE family multidrug resistance protein